MCAMGKAVFEDQPEGEYVCILDDFEASAIRRQSSTPGMSIDGFGIKGFARNEDVRKTSPCDPNL